MLDGLDAFVGRVLDRVDLGDHVGFVVDVTAGHADRMAEPLLGFQWTRRLDAGNPA